MEANETLAIVGDALDPDDLERLRRLAESGATVLAWQHSRIVQDRFPSPEVASRLDDARIPSLTIAEAVGEQEDLSIDDAVISWMKGFGREHFRGQFRYRGLELWWWAELYLYHDTPLRLLLRDIEALARIVAVRQPDRIVLFHAPRRVRQAAQHFVDRVEICRGERDSDRETPRWWKTTLLHAGDLAKMLGSGVKSLFRRHPPRLPGKPRVFFLTHASMWRDGHEIYFDRILPEVSARAGGAIVVAFGPSVPFRQRTRRGWLGDLFELGQKERPYRSVREYLTVSRSFRLSLDFARCWLLFYRFRPGRALSHRGVALGPQGRACFRDTFLRQFPWALRSYAEVQAVLATERPDVLTLYAESSGLGRAAVAAAKARGIPSVAVQHGIMYPRYYSHEHAPDEMVGEDAVPVPTRTAVFGNMAKALLVERGHYDEEQIVVTGSPKFDALVDVARGYDAEATRNRLGVPKGFRLLVLATRWSAVSSVFDELVKSVEQVPGVVLYVKPHQAEPAAPYEAVLSRRRAQRTRIVSGAANLIELIVGSDGLVTVDSLASSEALVVGRPVLLVNLPSNLSALAERGVAFGVRRGDSIEAALRKFLLDPELARRLEAKRQAYIQDFAYGADGRSTERIVAAIFSAGGAFAAAASDPVDAVSRERGDL